jgi:molybdate/tungstate transport system substrate-binding protein
LKTRYLVGVAVLATVLIFGGYVIQNFYGEEPQKIRILCAGSLLNPMIEVEASFEQENKGLDVEVEGHGSIQVIRHITELNDVADLLMVADYSLIPIMMYDEPLSGGNFTDWYIRFAGNRIVLAYTQESKYSEEINETNWQEILVRPEVTLGTPNPLIDALGYRSLMIVQLAENYFKNEDLFERVMGEGFEPEFETAEVDEVTYIFVPEQIKPREERILLRASSIQLVPLLESGALDYCFLYYSNAEQYGLPYIELPKEINLGYPDYNDWYSRVKVRYQHSRFQSIGLERKGKTIYYGLTIPNNAGNSEQAIAFIEYILGKEGKAIFSQQSHPIYEPAYTDNLERVPSTLRSYLVEEE